MSRNVWMAIGAFVFWLLLVRYVWVRHIVHNYSHDQLAYSTDTVAVKSTAKVSLYKNNQAVIGAYTPLFFDWDSHEPELSANNRALLGAVAAYFKEHPQEVLSITGRFYAGEHTPQKTIFDDIGLARAAALRDILIHDYKADEDRIVMRSEAFPTAQRSGTSAVWISFDVQVTPVAKEPTDTLWAVAKYEITNMTIPDANFASGSALLKATPQFTFYVDSLKHYLVKHPGKHIRIIGHTDSDGSDARNNALGLARAEAAKVFLRSAGIAIPILASSEGKRQPIVPNTTPKNKARNRRINIRVE